MIDRSKTDWYKDAVIYQTHIKAFRDSNADGVGDFQGLASRLDYIAALGVDTIWLLPFYPSPLRDDGYDIAEYETVNPAYGTFEDFRDFVETAHARGLRVITELVINHTSDQHPWFQRAREAPKGSSEREFYVWSDDDQRWMDQTRIIFNDTEKSNWSWDPVAKQYFWHRFYSHQPDLNFDHPPVMEEILRVMRLWLDAGVDGLRLDAIPYLVERDGTNNENLPETHAVLKRIRSELDAHYDDRMLLAEANQWPEDTRPYFGEGDECHMGFHFPLMPRMYMALAQEDRHPITDIMRQTPAIPEECQWAIFLRNHDELTLEMVTDRERDYMWDYYAADRKARINMGIRRRLAPLMGNDRRKIELMNAMLFSMPGTPVVYYGDEIGMGDNYYLGDRDGVRTPMQWSSDMNGGFSRANPQQLYLPAIQDPIYGYQAVNVEAQEHQPSSLLNWMKTMIAVRRREPAFGRGKIDFLYPKNRKVLAFVRTHTDDPDGGDGGHASNVLCVFNVSRSAQATELDLSAFKTAVPVELTSGNAFPPIGDLPYLLTLPPFGFFWFSLSTEDAMPEWHVPYTETLPEFITLTCSARTIDAATDASNAKALARDVLPDFLRLQRWFSAKDERIEGCELDRGVGLGEHRLALARADMEGGERQTYLLPLAALWGEEHLLPESHTLPQTLAKLRRTNLPGALVDATSRSDFGRDLIAAMLDGTSTRDGDLAFEASVHDEGLAAARDAEPAPLGVEQSNVSLAAGPVLLKVYRRLRRGVQPEIEMSRYLTGEAGFANTPKLLGEASLRRDGEDRGTVIAAAFDFVLNQGDGWNAITEALVRDITDRLADDTAARRDAPDETVWPYPLNLGETIGRRTGEMHRALARETHDPDFAPEPVGHDDMQEWAKDARAQAKRALKALDGTEGLGGSLLERADEIDALIEQLTAPAEGAVKTRIHGDYHLGQLLVAQDDVYVIDFEGEPLRPMDERRQKSSPQRDVAGMLRSFDYAAHAALDTVRLRGVDDVRAAGFARDWRDDAVRDFLAAYDEARGDAGDASLRDLFVLTKALYEIGYEAANRPDWLSIPVRGVVDLLDG